MIKPSPAGESSRKADNTVVVSLPKPNLQIVILGLIALITLFQTVQLMRINSSSSQNPVKAAPANTNSESGTGGSTDTPQSMVGGC